ncbi:MAG TPA: hypothetical protein VM261_04610 [Kofleriaceae bacterium]|nr:hypothetical protein [Kofleriaceae bacterium]
MLGRVLTVLVASLGSAACASGHRSYNVYLEASAGFATTTIDGERAFGPTVGAHFGVAKETEHSDGMNVHMGAGGLVAYEGTEIRAGLAMLGLHVDYTTSRETDGSRINRWATLVEGPLLVIAGETDGEWTNTGAVSVATGPAREWRAHNGLLAGAGVMARGLVGGHATGGGGVELRVRIGVADRPHMHRR